MIILSWSKSVESWIMKNPWRNLKPDLSMNLHESKVQLREQTDDIKEKSTEDTSRGRGVQIQLRMSAQWDSTEDVADPIKSPQDYDIRQSGRVRGLQSSDLWLRPTDLSWHFRDPHDHLWVTVRKLSSKNIRKMEEQGEQDRGAKKQKIKRNEDERSYRASSSSWSSNEYLFYKDIFKDIHDDENNVSSWRTTIFSTFV